MNGFRPAHAFVVGERDFFLDGAPFVIRCGEIHYPRVPREYWRHRLQLCRALGLNSVCVYLFWNFHEWNEGEFLWTGDADVAEFCRMAQEEGLWVLLRPGPYSCAEWEMGGLPWWLTKLEGIGLRSTDPRFLAPATRYLKEVGRVLAPFQVTRGGPILMVQVENEYGSFGKDPEYMGAIRQALLDAGFEVPLFACNPVGDLANGYREDLFQVVNFGAGAGPTAFEALQKIQPSGPLMNGEYYPAWFDMWGRRHRTGDIQTVVSDLDYMLKNHHSFSMYMAHGGTSFGLWAGADRPFSPDTTSYDYDAPISEAGWVTPKFEAIRKVMAGHLQPEESIPNPPAPNPVIGISSFHLEPSASLFDFLPQPKADDTPRTMEFYEQSRGAILYRTTLPAGPAGTLCAEAVHDFAWVFLNGDPVGMMDRRGQKYSVQIPARDSASRLDLLVYAMGRVNFGKEVFDRKGVFAPVTMAGSEILNWEVFSLPLDDGHLASLQFAPTVAEGPAYWRGTFRLDLTGDTFLDMRTWGKGVVWVNGHCLGRFWNIGPTQTLYVPAPWLLEGQNEVLVLDFLGPSSPVLAGLREPILDELHPERDFSRKTRAVGRFIGNSPVASGSFPSESGWHEVRFSTPSSGRYLCLEAQSAHDKGPSCTVAELDAIDVHGTSMERSAWKVLWVSSEETNYVAGDAENAIDGQNSTFWHTDAGMSVAGPPHQIVVDLGKTLHLGGIRYLPRSGDAIALGRIREFNVYLSDQAFGLTLDNAG